MPPLKTESRNKTIEKRQAASKPVAFNASPSSAGYSTGAALKTLNVSIFFPARADGAPSMRAVGGDQPAAQYYLEWAGKGALLPFPLFSEAKKDSRPLNSS
ncbi:MAG: hypothetical protein ACREI9_07510 [Nitrospiraceae bacterium]